MRYDLELPQPLVDAQGQPVVAQWVTLSVSFSEDGAADAGGIARASANEAVILGVSLTTIRVQNQGCQEYWLLVAAGTGATQP
jgi:hypothetical protein